MSKVDPSETKSLLRDWMTFVCQSTKVKDNKLTSQQLADTFNSELGIKMNEKWVDRALYGAKGKPKGHTE